MGARTRARKGGARAHQDGDGGRAGGGQAGLFEYDGQAAPKTPEGEGPRHKGQKDRAHRSATGLGVWTRRCVCVCVCVCVWWQMGGCGALASGPTQEALACVFAFRSLDSEREAFLGENTKEKKENNW